MLLHGLAPLVTRRMDLEALLLLLLALLDLLQFTVLQMEGEPTAVFSALRALLLPTVITVITDTTLLIVSLLAAHAWAKTWSKSLTLLCDSAT